MKRARVLSPVGALAAAALVAGCSSSSHPDQAALSTSVRSSAAPTSSSATSTSASPPASTSASRAPAKLVYRSGLATPDPAVTPGAALPGVGTTQICTKEWNAKHKTISYAVQNEVSARYGVIAGPGTTLHLDQLIPASLGGDASVRNVWPQPQSEQMKKNALESRLRQRVCEGQLSLTTAQRAIATNWPAAARDYPPS